MGKDLSKIKLKQNSGINLYFEDVQENANVLIVGNTIGFFGYVDNGNLNTNIEGDLKRLGWLIKSIQKKVNFTIIGEIEEKEYYLELFNTIYNKYNLKAKVKFMTTTNNEDYFEYFNKFNDMPKFDYCIMNPPYAGSLHLDFLDKVTNISDKIVIIEPGQWLVQLKENGKYTKENSISSKIKNKIERHVKSVELNNYNRELHIANKTVFSITSIDFTKEYNEIDFECVTEKSKVSSLKDCNLIGEDRLVSSILKKCKNYKDHMIDHCINLKKYKDYEDKGYYFLRYSNYMLHNLGGVSKCGHFTPASEHKGKLIDTLISYFEVLALNKDLVYNKVPRGVQKNNISDATFGTKEELENWQYFVYNNKLAVFINICLTIDEHNNSREYIPWLVDKKYTDEEIYKLLDITEEEQELIDKTIKNFDKDSKFGKRLFSVE